MANPPNAPWPPGAQPPGAFPPPPGGGGPYPPGGPWPPGGAPPPPAPRRNGTGLVIALVAGGLVVVLVAVVAAFVLLRDDSGGELRELRVGQIAGGAEARPGEDGSLTMVRPGVERPVVEIYEDFACPPCGKFDRANDPMLKQLAVAGQAKVIFRPMVVFSRGNEPMYGNSLRAASALRCVTDGARWLSYQDVLYNHQPAQESSRGYEISDLLSYGASVGLTDDAFRRCVTDQARSEDVLSASRTYTTSHGVQGTPSVRVDGRMLGGSDVQSPDAIRRAIEAAG